MLLREWELTSVATEKINKFKVAHPRLDEVLMSLRWYLCRDGQDGHIIFEADPPWRVYEMELQFFSATAIYALYTIEDGNRTIKVHDIEVVV